MYDYEDRINYKSEFPKKKEKGYMKWISVKKSKPNVNTLIFVYTKRQKSFQAFYNNGKWNPIFPTELLENYDNWSNLHFGEMNNCVIPDVTHWMYIPPPKEK